MKPTKKYPSVDPLKNCPLAFQGIKCDDCRLAIPRYSPEEIQQERETGNYEIVNDLHSCTFQATLIELQKMNKR